GCRGRLQRKPDRCPVRDPQPQCPHHLRLRQQFLGLDRIPLGGCVGYGLRRPRFGGRLWSMLNAEYKFSGYAFAATALDRGDMLRADADALAELWPDARVLVLDTDGRALAMA